NNYSNEMQRPVVRTSKGQMIWNAAIVVALGASAVLFVNNRQLSNQVAQMNRDHQEQMARLTQDLSQSSASAQQSMESLARQSQETAAQAEMRAKQEVRKSSASLSAELQ